MPRCAVGGRAQHHLVDGVLVLVPPLTVAVVLLSDLVLLVRGLLPGLEARELLLLRDVQPELGDVVPPVDELLFEVVDLVVRPLPLRSLGESFNALHEHPAVPRPVEDREPPGQRHVPPEAPQVVVLALILGRSGSRNHPVVTSLQRLRHPADHPALTCGVPTLEGQHRRHTAITGLNTEPVELGLLPAQLNLVLLLGELLGQIHARQDRRLTIDVPEHRVGQ